MTPEQLAAILDGTFDLEAYIRDEITKAVKASPEYQALMAEEAAQLHEFLYGRPGTPAPRGVLRMPKRKGGSVARHTPKTHQEAI